MITYKLFEKGISIKDLPFVKPFKEKKDLRDIKEMFGIKEIKKPKVRLFGHEEEQE